MFGGSFGGGGSFRSTSMGGGGMPGMYQHQQRVRKQDPIVQNLKCTLNELYSGSQRKMKVSRKIMVDERRRREMDEVLTVDVKPGWKAGTKITFNSKGDEYPGTEPADLIFGTSNHTHPPTHTRTHMYSHTSTKKSGRAIACVPSGYMRSHRVCICETTLHSHI